MIAEFAFAVLANNYTWCSQDEFRTCDDRITALSKVFEDVGERYSIPPHILASISWHETRWNPWAVGPAGSRGSMQIHPLHGCPTLFLCSESYREWCRVDADGCQTPVVEYAADLLLRMVNLCGSLRGGLSRYNSGSCYRGDKYAIRVLDTARKMKNFSRPLSHHRHQSQIHSSGSAK